MGCISAKANNLRLLGFCCYVFFHINVLFSYHTNLSFNLFLSELNFIPLPFLAPQVLLLYKQLYLYLGHSKTCLCS